MRLLFLCLFFTAIVVNAQNEIVSKDKMPDSDRIVLAVYHDIWSGLPQGVETKAFNRGFSFHFFYDYPLGSSPVALAIGGGMSSHNLYSNAMPVKDFQGGLYTGNTVFSPIDSVGTGGPFSYSKNKLNLNYFEIPLELRFRFPAGNSYIKISLGAKAGFLVNAHTKYKGDNLSGLPGKEKTKTFMIPNIEMLRYNAYGRLAYNNWGAFYSMQFNSVFKKDNGPEMIPASLGVFFSW